MIETYDHKMQCLICNEVIKTLKKDNARQHYRLHVDNPCLNPNVEQRKMHLNNLKTKLSKSSSLLKTLLSYK